MSCILINKDIEVFGENPKKVPCLFQRLIDKMRLESELSNNELLFLTVMYNLVEMGFIICHPNFKDIETAGYNSKVLKGLCDIPSDELFEKSGNSFYPTLMTKLRLGPVGNPQATLLGQPSLHSKSEYLTVHMFVKELDCLASGCFNTSDFLVPNQDCESSISKSFLLARLIKENIGIPVKQPLLLASFNHCVPHLQRLPDHILIKIRNYLPERTKRLFDEACFKA